MKSQRFQLKNESCTMQENYKQKADKFHIIGHSIGAHAAGEAGSKIPGLARITGELFKIHKGITMIAVTAK